MRKIAKITCLMFCLALLLSIIPFNATAASSDYETFEFVKDEVRGGVYKEGLDGPFDNTYFDYELPQFIGVELIDRDLEISWWSKPINFTDLHDQGGTWVPAIYCNMTRDGQPAKNVAGFKYWLRDLWDCLPQIGRASCRERVRLSV